MGSGLVLGGGKLDAAEAVQAMEAAERGTAALSSAPGSAADRKRSPWARSAGIRPHGARAARSPDASPRIQTQTKSGLEVSVPGCVARSRHISRSGRGPVNNIGGRYVVEVCTSWHKAEWSFEMKIRWLAVAGVTIAGVACSRRAGARPRAAPHPGSSPSKAAVASGPGIKTMSISGRGAVLTDTAGHTLNGTPITPRLRPSATVSAPRSGRRCPHP